jgi:hypothetical protein
MSGGTAAPLYGVWGSSGSDLFAVGEGGTILHYAEPKDLPVAVYLPLVTRQ